MHPYGIQHNMLRGGEWWVWGAVVVVGMEGGGGVEGGGAMGWGRGLVSTSIYYAFTISYNKINLLATKTPKSLLWALQLETGGENRWVIEQIFIFYLHYYIQIMCKY